MRHGRLALAAALGLLVLASTAACAAEPLAVYTLTLSDGKQLTVTQKSATLWHASDKAGDWSVAIGAKEYSFLHGRTTVATGKLKAGKLKMMVDGDKLYLVLKTKGTKTKIGLTEEAGDWEIKFKPDKAKLVKDDKELAKCKHYADTGKLKVKDADGDTVIESRDFKKLAAAPLALVVPGLDAERRVCLLLLLFALGK